MTGAEDSRGNFYERGGFPKKLRKVLDICGLDESKLSEVRSTMSHLARYLDDLREDRTGVARTVPEEVMLHYARTDLTKGFTSAELTERVCLAIIDVFGDVDGWAEYVNREGPGSNVLLRFDGHIKPTVPNCDNLNDVSLPYEAWHGEGWGKEKKYVDAEAEVLLGYATRPTLPEGGRKRGARYQAQINSIFGKR